MENRLTSAHLMFRTYVLNTYADTTLTCTKDGDWVLFGIKYSGASPTKLAIWVPKHVEAIASRATSPIKITLNELLSSMPVATLREFVIINKLVLTHSSTDPYDGTTTYYRGKSSDRQINLPMIDAIIGECSLVMAAEGTSASQSSSDLSTRYASLHAEYADLLAKYEKIKKIFE